MVRQRLFTVDQVRRSSESLLEASGKRVLAQNHSTGDAFASRAASLAAATGAVLEHLPSVASIVKAAPEHPALPASATLAEQVHRLGARSSSGLLAGVFEQPALILFGAGCVVTLAVVCLVLLSFVSTSREADEQETTTDRVALAQRRTLEDEQEPAAEAAEPDPDRSGLREEADDTARAVASWEMDARTTDGAGVISHQSTIPPAISQLVSAGGHMRDSRKMYKGASQELKEKLGKAHSREMLVDLLRSEDRPQQPPEIGGMSSIASEGALEAESEPGPRVGRRLVEASLEDESGDDSSKP